MSDSYITPEPVTYDPSVDPNNMSQYEKKDYKVSAVYQKLDIADSKEDEASAPLPKYIEAIQDIEAQDPSPPYEQLELDNFKDGNNDNNNRRTRKNKKLFKFAIHFIGFLIVFSCIQAMFAPIDFNSFGCGGDSKDLSNRPDFDDHHFDNDFNGPNDHPAHSDDEDDHEEDDDDHHFKPHHDGKHHDEHHEEHHGERKGRPEGKGRPDHKGRRPRPEGRPEGNHMMSNNEMDDMMESGSMM